MCYTNSKHIPATIKIIKNAYLDDRNNMTVVDTTSTATMEVEDGGDTTQNAKRRKNGTAVAYDHEIGGRIFKI